MEKRLTFTHIPEASGESALEELRAFYRRHSSPYVKERDPQQLIDAIKDRKVLVLRDEQGNLRATCGIFAYGDGTFREAGGVRVLDNGFGLQALLMSAAVVLEWAFDPPSESIFAATAQDNEPSIRSILRAGFEDVSDLGGLRMAALGMTEMDLGKRYFLFPEGRIAVALTNLRAMLKYRRITKDGNTIWIDVKPPFTDFEE